MQNVNYIQHQQLFIAYASNDKRLHASDISLYFILFHCWNKHHFQTIFSVKRTELMQLSHIGSRAAYICSIRRLQDCGYIFYKKSLRQFEESRIMMMPLSERPETGPLTGSETGPHVRPENRPARKQETGPHTGAESRPHTGPEPGLFYNKTNINNSKRERVNSDSRPGEKFITEIFKKNPTLEEAQGYFKVCRFLQYEARKFFFHYQSIGWTISGTPICDWHAAAQKWAENIDSISRAVA